MFCRDITKLLKLAQNDMVLFYFLKMFWCGLQTSPHPLLYPQREEHWPSPFPLVASMLAPPASAYAARGIAYAWQLNSILFFPKMLAALNSYAILLPTFLIYIYLLEIY